MIAFIAEHKDHRVGDDGLRWGVEPLCTVLSVHGIGISASTYYEWVTRKPSARALRDEQVAQLIRAERDANQLVAGLGSRKMWLRLRSRGHDVARCTVERLYRLNGWEGAWYGKKPRTTIPDEKASRAADRVHRDSIRWRRTVCELRISCATRRCLTQWRWKACTAVLS